MTREEKAAYMRVWRKTPTGIASEKRRKESVRHKEWLAQYSKSGKRIDVIRRYYQKHKAELYAKVKAYREAYKEKYRAHYIAEYHHEDAQLCSVVGCGAQGERHHPDYTKPREVLWLCRKHHTLLHLK